MAASVQQIDSVFQALANPTRRAVVEKLGRGPAAVRELAEPFDMALPSFMQHLKVLESSGLVRSSKRGRVRTVSIVGDNLERASAWLDRQRSVWERRLDQLDAYVKDLEEDERMRDLPQIDPTLDLVLERVVDVRPELVWRAWTEPEHVKRWFAPLPWTTVACEIDLTPGGLFSTTMRSDEGVEQPPNVGCYLEVVEHRRLVWTDALLPGYRPSGKPFLTAAILLEPHGPNGTETRYTAIAMHGDAATRERHEEMGFHYGWATALDQLVAVAREL